MGMLAIFMLVVVVVVVFMFDPLTTLFLAFAFVFDLLQGLKGRSLCVYLGGLFRNKMNAAPKDSRNSLHTARKIMSPIQIMVSIGFLHSAPYPLRGRSDIKA